MEFLRRRLGLILRTVVSVALIAYLVHMKIDWRQVLGDLRKMDPRWLLASLAAFIPSICIISWRWKILLAAHDVRFRFWRLLELNMIGTFFSSFLIGTTGGDVVKIFYVARSVPQQKIAVSLTVVVDRVIGMVAMLLLGTAFAWTQVSLLISKPDTRAATATFYIIAAIGACGAALAAAGPLLLRIPAISALSRKLPFVHRDTPIFAAYERTAAHLGTNLLALLVSFPSFFCMIGMGYCVVRAMNLHPDLLPFSAVILIVNMLIALPVSISGVGLREQLFIMFLGLLAIGQSHAFTFSITFYFMNTVWGLIGGLFYALYRHETHEPAPNTAQSEAAAVLSQP